MCCLCLVLITKCDRFVFTVYISTNISSRTPFEAWESRHFIKYTDTRCDGFH